MSGFTSGFIYGKNDGFLRHCCRQLLCEMGRLISLPWEVAAHGGTGQGPPVTCCDSSWNITFYAMGLLSKLATIWQGYGMCGESCEDQNMLVLSHGHLVLSFARQNLQQAQSRTGQGRPSAGDDTRRSPQAWPRMKNMDISCFPSVCAMDQMALGWSRSSKMLGWSCSSKVFQPWCPCSSRCQEEQHLCCPSFQPVPLGFCVGTTQNLFCAFFPMHLQQHLFSPTCYPCKAVHDYVFCLFRNK